MSKATQTFSDLLRQALRARIARNTWTPSEPPPAPSAPNTQAGAGTQAPQPAAPKPSDIMNSLIRGRR